MPETDIEATVIVKSPSGSVSFALPYADLDGKKRVSTERGRISLHIDSLNLAQFQPQSNASLSIAVSYLTQEGESGDAKFQTPFVDLDRARKGTLTWSENITLPDPRHTFANPRLCFELVMSTKNKLLRPKKTVIGRSKAQSIDSLFRSSSGEVDIPFQILQEGSSTSSPTPTPILRIQARRLAPVPVYIKKIGQ